MTKTRKPTETIRWNPIAWAVVGDIHYYTMLDDDKFEVGRCPQRHIIAAVQEYDEGFTEGMVKGTVKRMLDIGILRRVPHENGLLKDTGYEIVEEWMVDHHGPEWLRNTPQWWDRQTDDEDEPEVDELYVRHYHTFYDDGMFAVEAQHDNQGHCSFAFWTVDPTAEVDEDELPELDQPCDENDLPEEAHEALEEYRNALDFGPVVVDTQTIHWTRLCRVHADRMSDSTIDTRSYMASPQGWVELERFSDLPVSVQKKVRRYVESRK